MIAIAGKNVGREVFCMMHSAFSPPGPRHFNKEQTPLAILRYQPTVSRWCFRCFGAHLLRSPQIVKSGLNHSARFLATCGHSPPVENLGSPAPSCVLCQATSSRRAYASSHSALPFVVKFTFSVVQEQ